MEIDSAVFSKEKYNDKILKSQGENGLENDSKAVGVQNLSLRAKFILHSVLLVVALLGVFFAARAAIGAVAAFQHQNALARTGDVRTIRPWMTVPFISRNYHVHIRSRLIQCAVYETLNITRDYPTHSTLQTIAIHAHHPVNELIHKLQTAITAYRKQHPFHPQFQQRSPSHSLPKRQPTPGRVAY